uniref:uncharacterized protein LOC120337585 n=1 Tax=Styela clava TaxID=7725 RepID=UPI0019394E14|nr:uncharacterized protein LOC120337585 [Styela clava]
MIFKAGVCTSLIFFRRYKRSRIFITLLDFVAEVWNVIAVTVYGAKYPTFSGGETAEFGLSFRLAIGSIAMTFLICPILWLILKPKNAQSGYLTDRDTNANQQPIDMELVGNSFVRSAYAF